MKTDLPLIVRPSLETDVVTWLRDHEDLLRAGLIEAGAVLLRGFRDSGESAFRSVVNQLCQGGLDYVYRSTPRTDLGGGLYTATEYPPGLSIPFHNENAFQRQWPLLLLFACILPAENGAGQTPLADTLAVTRSIDPGIRQRFSEKHVMYIRHYREDIDLPWQTVFQSTDRLTVEEYCKENDIHCEWKKDGTLVTRQVCQAVARHPRTGDSIWFNQAHLFHPSALDLPTKEVLQELFSPDEYPRNATYGDGTPLEESVLQEIRQAYKEHARLFVWQQGDILILDNMMISHARTPFKGSRRILTSMGEQYRPDYVSPFPY